MKEKELPAYTNKSFTCPHCGIYSQIQWHMDKAIKTGDSDQEQIYFFGQCVCCEGVLCFKHEYMLSGIFCDVVEKRGTSTMLYPKNFFIILNEGMPKNVREVCEEASLVLGTSPRASCALLRLALQELIKYLKENISEYSELKGGNLCDDICGVVNVGNFNQLQKDKLQKAMDSIRLIGNNAVHPSELNINDNLEIARTLFDMINFIVKEVVVKPKEFEKKLEEVQKYYEKK